MSQSITIQIEKKIATCLTELPIVCGNSDYIVRFEFDEEWENHSVKTARFRVNGKYTDVVFEGNDCPMPIILDTKIVWVGVFAGELSTSTPAIVHCKPSILDGDDVPAPPREDVYSQIVGLCEDALEKAQSVEDRANNGEFDGEDGLSAYQVAVKNGFEGTEEEWLKSLAVEVEDGIFAPLVDGKVPAENLPSYMDDVIEGAMETSFGAFYPTGEHNEKLSEYGFVIPRKGVLYVDVNGAHVGKVFRWSGTSYVQVASTNLPEPDSYNEGMFLKSNGSYYVFETVRQLPIFSQAMDGGKVLIVDDATRTAAWVTPPWVEKSYVDELVGGVEEELLMINEGGLE